MNIYPYYNHGLYKIIHLIPGIPAGVINNKGI